MGRPVDNERRNQVLDEVLLWIGEHGLEGVSLRPIADTLGLSLNGLVHHVGKREDLIYRVAQQSITHQSTARKQWVAHKPGLSQADLFRRWWRWLWADPFHTAIARLGIEVTTQQTSPGGLAEVVGADRIAHWRYRIEDHLVTEGVPAKVAKVEANLARAMFTGLVVEVLAGVPRREAGGALEIGLARLEQVVWTNAGLSEPSIPAGLQVAQRSATWARSNGSSELEDP